MRTNQGRCASSGRIGFAHTAQRLLAAAGVYDYNARWYSLSLRRFLSADSLVAGAANPQAFNRYAYAANDPLRFVDPSGHRLCEGPALECDIPTRLHSGGLFIPPMGKLWISGSLFDEETHRGLDLGPPPQDTTIGASAQGTVVISDACTLEPCDYAGSSGRPLDVNNGYGNVVVIEYSYWVLPIRVRRMLALEQDQSLFMLYAHLKEPSILNPGDMVEPAATIGNVGATGNSSGPHLHLEVRIAESGSLAPGEMCTSFSCYDLQRASSRRYGDPDAR